MAMIVWLDAKVETDAENRKAQPHLLGVINNLKTFENSRQCLNFLRDDKNKNPTILIVSGGLGKELVPNVVALPQIQRIYVYCGNEEANRSWAESYQKIALVTKDFPKLLAHLRSNPLKIVEKPISSADQTSTGTQSQRRSEEPFAFSTSDRSIFAIDKDFLNWQLLIEILLRLKPKENPCEDFRRYFSDPAKNDGVDPKIFEEFCESYQPERAIWWYTRDSFVSRLLNEALRKEEGQDLYVLKFFIRDLRTQLVQNQCQDMVKVWRTQKMSKTEAETLLNSKDKWISINTFMIATTNQEAATDSESSEDVLFEIDAFVDTAKHRPYAEIGQLSHSQKSDEVLFMLGSVFHVKAARKRSDGTYKIDLVQCSRSDDQAVAQFYEHLEKEIGQGETTPYSFGDALRRMSRFNDAAFFFKAFLSKNADDPLHQANYYRHSGDLFLDKNDPRECLKAYDKALDLFAKQEKKREVADLHVKMALVYNDQNNFKKAREAFQEALSIYKSLNGDQDHTVAMCYDRIGDTYEKQNKHFDALHYRTSALVIWKTVSDTNYPILGQSYAALGMIDVALGLYDRALDNFDRALEIYEKSLPPNNPRVALAYKNKGLALEKQDRRQEAVGAYQKAMAIYKNVSSTTNDDISDIEEKLKNLLG